MREKRRPPMEQSPLLPMREKRRQPMELRPRQPGRRQALRRGPCRPTSPAVLPAHGQGTAPSPLAAPDPHP